MDSNQSAVGATPSPQETTQQQGSTDEQAKPNLLEQVLVETGYRVGDEGNRKKGETLISAFLREALKGTPAGSADVQDTIAAHVARIDGVIAKQLNPILHQQKFQKLESTWRGLRYLVENCETGENLRIKVLNVSKDELLTSLSKTMELDQSAVFKKVYEEEYATWGGQPFGAIIGNYEFGKTDRDLAGLEKMAGVAAAAHAPFLSGAAPDLLNMNTFTQLKDVRDIAAIFRSAEHARWRAFRESKDAQYVCLTLPRMLMRLPYDPKNNPAQGLTFREDVDGRDHSKYLWANSAIALGARVAEAFTLYGWASSCFGAEHGRVKNLPTHTFITDEGDVALKCPTEIQISSTRDRELEEQGLTALVHKKGENCAAFFGVPSCQKPKQYYDDNASASAYLASQLPYTLAVCRFAHYLKAIVRERIGTPYSSPKECERELNEWIRNYVTPDDDATEVVKREKPLREARIVVEDIAGRPGYYRSEAFLRPHYFLKGLTLAMKLVAEIPKPQ